MFNSFCRLVFLLFQFNVSSKLIEVVKGSSMCSRLCSLSLEPKKILVININGMLCYFPTFSCSTKECQSVWKNLSKTKMEVRVRVEKFLNKAFQKFHIAIWSCMKLEDVLEVLPRFMLESFLDQFIFIWGHE
jgi:hypothetical protein